MSSLPNSAAVPLTGYQKKLFVFLSVATFFEGYDFYALTQVLPHLRHDFALDHADTSSLLAFVNFGTVLAFLLIGRADRWGRKRVLTITIAGYTLFTALSGFAPNIFAFACFQMLARIFLIGEWATSMVIAAEEYPAQRRGMVMGVVGAAAGLGSILCVVVVPPLTAHFGWRSVYVVGIIPLLLLAYSRRGLRETERFVAMNADPQSSTETHSSTGIVDLMRGPLRNRVFQLGAIWFLTYIATQNAVSLWKDYAMTEVHLKETQAGMAMTIAALLAMPLNFASGKLIDVIGRRPGASVILLALAGGVVGSYTFTSPALLTVSLTLCVVGAGSVLTVLNAFTTELFPTHQRAAAYGASNNLLGRIGYVLSPLAIGMVAVDTGWGVPLRWSALGPLLALVLVWVFLPETKARELEETAA